MIPWPKLNTFLKVSLFCRGNPSGSFHQWNPSSKPQRLCKTQSLKMISLKDANAYQLNRSFRRPPLQKLRNPNLSTAKTSPSVSQSRSVVWESRCRSTRLKAVSPAPLLPVVRAKSSWRPTATLPMSNPKSRRNPRNEHKLKGYTKRMLKWKRKLKHTHDSLPRTS
jgi:hypothetical protein